MEMVGSSFANVIVSISLFSCVLLLLSLSIRNFLFRKGWSTRGLKILELFFRWLPIFLFLILMIRYISGHLFLNLSHAHVAYHLDSGSSVKNRFISLFVGYDGASIMLMSIIIIVHILLFLDKKIFIIKNKDMIDRWFSLLWIICLAGILPEQTFNLIENGYFSPINEELLFSSAKNSIFASLIFGILLGLGPHSMELDSNNKEMRLFLRFFAILGVFSILFGPLDAFVPLASTEWDINLFSEPEILRLGTIVFSLMLFCFIPLVLYYAENLDSTVPAGKNRSIGLAFSILIGIFSLLLSSIFLLYPHWSLSSIFYELILDLFPILLLALVFSLLPVLGLDERARPELHGWRYGLFIGVIIGCLNSSSLSLSLINGWLIALMFSLTIPIIVEKSPLINSKMKIYNLGNSICFVFLLILLSNLFSDLRIISTIFSIGFIILMEINNSQLPKRKISS